jgi:hypothetical protein
MYIKKYTLACKGDTLPALLVWFHHNLAGFSNSNNDFCCFLWKCQQKVLTVSECIALSKFVKTDG